MNLNNNARLYLMMGAVSAAAFIVMFKLANKLH